MSWHTLTPEEALSLLARSGCMGVLIGFESLSPDNLKLPMVVRKATREMEAAMRARDVKVDMPVGIIVDRATGRAWHRPQSVRCIAARSVSQPVPGCPARRRWPQRQPAAVAILREKATSWQLLVLVFLL